jgi:hypothetical protein
MPRLVRPWLTPFDWDFVLEINRGLCKQKHALHKPTSDGYAPAKSLWEQNQTRDLSLMDALDVCLRCHRLAPFCFYNGNTFAAIARDFVAELAPGLSPDKVHILRSIAGHIVAGTATEVERKQLDAMLAKLEK